jgi:acyl dehydratase
MARLSGFKSVILHGFAQMAIMAESLLANRCGCGPGGDPRELRVLDVRFIAPLVLPNEIEVHVSDSDSTIYVTSQAGKLVHMVGSFDLGPAAAIHPVAKL